MNKDSQTRSTEDVRVCALSPMSVFPTVAFYTLTGKLQITLLSALSNVRHRVKNSTTVQPENTSEGCARQHKRGNLRGCVWRTVAYEMLALPQTACCLSTVLFLCVWVVAQALYYIHGR